MLPGPGGKRGFGRVSNTSLSTLRPSFLKECVFVRLWGGGRGTTPHARPPGRASETNVRVHCPESRVDDVDVQLRLPDRRGGYIHISSSGHQMTRIVCTVCICTHSLHSVHMYSHVVRRTRIEPDTTSNSNMYILYVHVHMYMHPIRGWLAVADLLPLYDQTTSEISSPMHQQRKLAQYLSLVFGQLSFYPGRSLTSAIIITATVSLSKTISPNRGPCSRVYHCKCPVRKKEKKKKKKTTRIIFTT